MGSSSKVEKMVVLQLRQDYKALCNVRQLIATQEDAAADHPPPSAPIECIDLTKWAVCFTRLVIVKQTFLNYNIV